MEHGAIWEKLLIFQSVVPFCRFANLGNLAFLEIRMALAKRF
jgi:hypothetical protein